MSKPLYRMMILGGAFVWLMIGMRLSSVLNTVDAGRTPEPNDWFLLLLLTITGVLNAVALLQLPMTQGRGSSGAPEQAG